MILHNSWIKEEIQEEIKRFIEVKDNIETNCQNVWKQKKTVNRGNLIEIHAYVRKIQDGKMKNLKGQLKFRKANSNGTQKQSEEKK